MKCLYATQSSKDYFRTYVRMPMEHNSKTSPVAVGVEMTSGFLDKASLLRNNIIQWGKLEGTGLRLCRPLPT